MDFTLSNKEFSDPTSLHALSGFNQYQKAMTDIGEIVLEYDSDKKIAALGFGAITPQTVCSVCVCVCVCIHAHAYAYIHIHIYAHVYINAYSDTCTHTHTHTHTTLTHSHVHTSIHKHLDQSGSGRPRARGGPQLPSVWRRGADSSVWHGGALLVSKVLYIVGLRRKHSTCYVVLL